ncbi:hypothetical protein LCGC14_1987740 [marine sediment metagenome]|uniref:Uncharacterized protein n=1 Tax=marine sediment metagenome TaxID=412755 RepID=A0A0F9I423_9ZZZZ
MIELPQMTHPLSRGWSQPPADQMAVYDDIAIMDQSTLALLPEYSTTIPTGAYEGKMWRRANGPDNWLLCWYGPSEKPDMVSINRRPIRLIRDEKEQ